MIRLQIRQRNLVVAHSANPFPWEPYLVSKSKPHASHEEAKEGRILMRAHRRRERNYSLIRKKKQRHLARTGSLAYAGSRARKFPSFMLTPLAFLKSVPLSTGGMNAEGVQYCAQRGQPRICL